MRKGALVVTQVLGILAFTYPFFIATPRSSITEARASEAPWLVALLVPLLVVITLRQVSEGKMSSKTIALLGVLAGCAAVLRLPVSFAGANLFFLVPILGGATFGPVFGFLLGSLGMLTSAVATGGIGPWLPFQMLAAGWVAAGAGLIGPLIHQAKGRWRAIPLALYGCVAAFFYGVAMNLYFWPVISAGSSAISWSPIEGARGNLVRFASFYVLTSASWDAVGAALNAVVLISLGPSAIDAMLRFKRRSQFALNRNPPTTAPDIAETPQLVKT